MTPGGILKLALRERRVECSTSLTGPVSKNRLRPGAVVGTLSALFVASFALTIAGCSHNLDEHKYAANHSTPSHLRSGSQTARNHQASVVPPSPPHCELMEPQPDIVDAELWARLKLDYERRCYQRAEMLVRKRLQRLLISGRCEIERD